MFTAREYVKAKSLDEAWELNQIRSNRIVGGMLWLKMSRLNINKLIDLSDLGLDGIEENEDEFIIGCMTPLRELELHPGLERYSCGAVREALRSIVGVQFRNLATVGGSIYGRYGFSDVLTVFAAMDSFVELHKGGIIPLSEFIGMKPDRDILVRLIIKKTALDLRYYSVRNSRTDFAVLNCAAAKTGDKLKLVFGARPGRAMIFEKNLLEVSSAASLAGEAAEAIETRSNLRAGADYRTHLVRVFAKRAYNDLGGGEKC